MLLMLETDVGGLGIKKKNKQCFTLKAVVCHLNFSMKKIAPVDIYWFLLNVYVDQIVGISTVKQ